MALVLGAVLLAAGAALPPALPAPRDLARSVLETHGQELRLLKMLGVARTTFDWGTHFSINFTARQPACPKHLPERRGAGCQARPGRVQRCTAQVSVFAFLPDVPLSMVECGKELVIRECSGPVQFLQSSPEIDLSCNDASSNDNSSPQWRVGGRILGHPWGDGCAVLQGWWEQGPGVGNRPVLVQRGRFGRFLGKIRHFRPRIKFYAKAGVSVRVG
ncbi:hypothetical protein AAES_69095 [Amazona aestiva]|uniref:Uncharacterized protein n=1 Tax=Amazona aestiva TaxID=12930 RepID=A0A0Q3PPI9_AMAAE|nr:hypothetical protein AAES_69095 [Amazona aestiva]